MGDNKGVTVLLRAPQAAVYSLTHRLGAALSQAQRDGSASQRGAPLAPAPREERAARKKSRMGD